MNMPQHILPFSYFRPDHGHLLGAYHHLCEEVYIPHFNACITTEKAALHNASMVKAFNEEKRKFLIAAQNQQKDDTLTFQFEKERMNKSRALAGQGLHSIRTAYGKVQEAATLYILSKIFPDSKVSEVGFCVPDPKITGDGRLLPPLGASPDALITHYVKKMGFKTIAEHIEIVEVKNTCPFGYANNHHVQHRRTFILSDRGPRTCPDAAWIPQVQWHILCANTQSGLLVSRSATKGLRVFRIYRDDEYIECMLFVIQKLYSEHVMRKIPPKKDCFAKLHQHQLLAQRTRSMAREAEVVVDIAGGDERLCVSGRHVLDDNLFLDKVVR